MDNTKFILFEADENNVVILYKMAQYYKHQHKLDKMIYNLKKASKLGHVDSMLDLALYYKKNKLYIDMIKYLLLAIERDSIKAIHIIGSYYFMIENDINKAIYYFKLGLKYNDDISMYNLAICYKKLNNFKMMIYYYEMAITRNNVNAMFNLALYYQEQKLFGDMIKYYNMAITNNCVDAMINLGKYYQDNEKYDTAIYYYDLAILKGSKQAYNNIGDCYRSKKDYNKMSKYWMMAVENGDETARTNLENFKLIHASEINRFG